MLDQAQLLGRPSGAFRRATLEAMARAPRARDFLAQAAGQPRRWLSFAARNRVAPLVAHALLELGIDAGARSIHDSSRRRIEALMDQLDEVAAALADDGIRLVALKNAGIARALSDCKACCPMGDIDVLIERERFVDAHRRLADLGFEHASRSAVDPADLEHALASGGAEYRRQVGEHEVWLELQWRPIAGRWIRADQEPSGSELVERSAPIAGSQARLLAPDDNLIQVCLHTAKHSFVRAPGLRLHTDVDRLVAAAPPDWGAIRTRCCQQSITTPCYFSLALAEALLDTPVPAAVLDELAPPRWKREAVSQWLVRVDLFEPDRPKFSRPALLAFQALLYDTPRGLVAALADADPAELGPRYLPRTLRRMARRALDLATRYQ